VIPPFLMIEAQPPPFSSALMVRDPCRFRTLLRKSGSYAVTRKGSPVNPFLLCSKSKGPRKSVYTPQRASWNNLASLSASCSSPRAGIMRFCQSGHAGMIPVLILRNHFYRLLTGYEPMTASASISTRCSGRASPFTSAMVITGFTSLYHSE
jgi:hypothetical protein